MSDEHHSPHAEVVALAAGPLDEARRILGPLDPGLADDEAVVDATLGADRALGADR